MAMETPYPSCQPSGLPWAPSIPESWQVLRNGRLFAHRVETGFPDLPILEVSLRTGVRVRDMQNLKRKQVMSQKEKYKRAAKGDIAYNMMRMWQGALGTAPVDGLVSPAYVVLKPYPEASGDYYSYLFRTQAYMREVNKFSRGIVADRNRLYWESFKQMPSLVPPRPEQDQIVAYLRAQDVQFARFIKVKLDLIKLLVEQKQLIINSAVTHGIDTSIKLKPSGVEWLGNVPCHWTLCRADHILDTVRRQIRISTLADTEVFHYSIPSISKTGDGVVESAATIDSDKLLLDGGELLVSKLNPHKKYILLSKPQSHPIVCSSEFVPLIPRKCHAEYAAYVFKSWCVSDYLQANARSATRSHSRVDPSLISKLWWAWPDIAEQKSIVEHIKMASKPLDDAIDAAKQEILFIREYRDRLIADVVTGQVDVRGWTPGPDDQISDEDLAALGDAEEMDAEGEGNDGDSDD